MFPVVQEVFSGIAAFLGPIFATIGAVIGGVINFIIGIFQSVFPIVQGVFSAIGNVIGTVVGVIVSIIQTIIGVVSAVFGAIFNVVGNIMNAVGNVISNIFNGIKGAWDGLTNFVSGIFNGIKNAIESVINCIKGFINGVIDNINFAIGIMNRIPGVNIGTISHLALGTLNWQGGFAIMNEYGNGELVNLPSGAQVISHSLSQRMVDTYASNMARMDKGNSDERNVVVNIAPTSLILDSREIGQAVYPTVKVKLDRERLVGGV